ncbi:MAG: polyhydroxyalkanoic acid system family protein [Xanthomonadales bacterium]|nr:polyhydroxyalkanoic acid system family protein [Xanthomonadales bacterium]
MSHIDICARHKLDHDAALTAADELAQDLAEKFSVDYGWDDEVIHFERPGVQGQIEVRNETISIQAHLGFLLIMLKPAIEEEIRRYLREHFGCAT